MTPEDRPATSSYEPPPAPLSAKGTEQAEELHRQVWRILGLSMGVRLGPDRWIGRLSTWQRTVIIFAVPALAWLAVLQAAGQPSEPKLVSLIAWGTFYFACASYLAQRATEEIHLAIDKDILPFVSPAYAAAVAQDLEVHYPGLFRIGLPLAVGIASLAASWWALDLDLATVGSPAAGQPTGERIVWAFFYFLAFYTAATAVTSARFYLSFARHLDLESGSFHILSAADTPVVRGLSRLATQVLIFWALIFLTIVSSMLLAVLPPGAYRLPADSKLLFAMVPVAGFFSLGFGTLVYLASEARIRAVLQRFASAEAFNLQQACNAALRPAPGAAPNAEEAKRLADLQDRVVAGARYGSRVGVSVSVALPLLMPIVSVLVNVLG